MLEIFKYLIGLTMLENYDKASRQQLNRQKLLVVTFWVSKYTTWFANAFAGEVWDTHGSLKQINAIKRNASMKKIEGIVFGWFGG